ncbi:hypothetical protein IQ249_23690 [Lusitaniella coriacea LEGE 07157]|uniref:Uncharacterized protein n=1 Tax=Lusitaniella coriacea LEGE 07157 TaxID=945747 RepID=A0A8J7E016_9CYAN|nr:hypothetical protein [Lusitaniella coriacea]MBE9118896.1 hypothetical protein [Lusitaniella coriacea LEGE 07157]
MHRQGGERRRGVDDAAIASEMRLCEIADNPYNISWSASFRQTPIARLSIVGAIDRKSFTGYNVIDDPLVVSDNSQS